MRYLLLFVSAWLLASFLSCGEGSDPIFETSIDTDLAAQEEQNERLDRFFNNHSLIPAKLLVRVSDIQGNPIGRTQVKIGDETYSTDNDGLVYIANQSLRPMANGLICTKEGYYEAIKSVNVTGGEQLINVALIQRSFSRNFIASLGGTIELQGVGLEFQPMSISRKDGTLYEGRVTVAAIHYDPADETFNQLVPGQFYGLNDQDQLSSLATYGMVQIEMTDADGNELEIRDGHKVAISIPASEIAPESIPLWNLNEDYGLWVEDGIAIKESGTYRFEVSHFSTYNCDVPIEPCDVVEDHRIKVLNNTGLTMRHQDLDLFVTIPEDASRMIPFGSITTDGFGEFQFISCIEVSSFYIKSANCNELNGPYNLNDVQTIELPEVQYDFDLAIEGSSCIEELVGNNFIGTFETRSATIGFGGIVGSTSDITLSSCVDVSTLDADAILSITVLNDRNILQLSDITVQQRSSLEWLTEIDYCNPQSVSDEYIIEFGDSWFEMEVLEQLSLDQISYAQAKEVTVLTLSYSTISNLSGIEFFPNLETLVISNAAIPNVLQQLQNNTSLEHLWLRSVPIKSDKGILNHPELKILRINDGELESLNEIAKLENLEVLELQQNGLRSVAEPLRSTGIHTLNLSQNNLTNVDGLESITLVKELDLSFNNISDFQGLRNLAILDSLYIVQNNLESFRWFPALSSLKKLDAQNVVMESFEGLSKLNGLHKLTIELTDGSMQELSNMVELRELTLSGNGSENRRVRDLSLLEPLKQLEVLRIDGLDSDDYSELSSFKELQELSIKFSQMNRAPDLSGLDNLEELNLSYNSINHIDALLKLNRLQRLLLTGNPISESDQQKLIQALPNTTIWF